MLSINEKDILDKATVNFFPKEGKWYNTCLNRPKTLEERNLPCHLRNNKWMAKLMSAMLKKDDIKIPVENIKYYMDHSKFFNEQRHAYELRIAKWQIEFNQKAPFIELCKLVKEPGRETDPMSLIGGQNSFAIPINSVKIPRDFYKDKLSRAKTLLSQIGLNKAVINEGIEEYLSSLDDASCEK